MHFYKPSNVDFSIETAFEYSSIPLFMQTQTLYHSNNQTRIVGEFLDDFREINADIEKIGLYEDPKSEAQVCLRFAIYRYPLKESCTSLLSRTIIQEQDDCLKRIKSSIESLIDFSFLGKLLYLNVDVSLISHVESLIRKHALDTPSIDSIVPDSIKNVFRCSLALEFVDLERGVDLFIRLFPEFDRNEGYIELYGDLFLVSQGLWMHEASAVDGDPDLSRSRNMGLGITNQVSRGTSVDPLSKLFDERRFWLLIQVDRLSSSAIISFYSETLGTDEKFSLLTSVGEKLRQCCERVNRVLLLENLVFSASINGTE